MDRVIHLKVECPGNVSSLQDALRFLESEGANLARRTDPVTPRGRSNLQTRYRRHADAQIPRASALAPGAQVLSLSHVACLGTRQDAHVFSESLREIPPALLLAVYLRGPHPIAIVRLVRLCNRTKKEGRN